MIKEVTGTEEESFHSPQRHFSPYPPPELEESPSYTKPTTKKGKRLHFSSSPSTTNIKVRNPFIRESTSKEAFEEQSLPKFSIQQKKKDKGQGIGKKPMEEKEETLVQKKKNKGKDIKKPNETDKIFPMQQEEGTMKNPVETVHVTTPPDK
jgi:hypothetical protein